MEHQGNRIHIIIITVLLSLFALGATAGTGRRYPGDFTFVKVPDPLSGDNPRLVKETPGEPKPGETWRDPVFGTILTRVTRASGDNGRHEYSRFDPVNADGTLIMLGPEKWGVYRTSTIPYNGREPVCRLDDCEEPRWDPVKPHVIWFTFQKALYHLHVLTGKKTLVRDFAREPALQSIMKDTRAWRITMRDEGEASRDNRYWVFAVQGGESVEYRLLYLFTWDRISAVIPGIMTIAEKESDLDWVGMSPLGNWVLLGGSETNGGRLRGMTIADPSLKRFHRIDYSTAHSDTALDTEGREVLVMQNVRTDYIDMIPLSWETKPILESGGTYQ